MSQALTIAVSMSDMQRMAEAVAKSGLFGVKNVDQALALMLVAQAEGLHPATAAMEYDVIQGKPARKASATLARFQASGGKFRYTERSDTRVAAIFSHPQGGEIEIDWTLDRAKKAGLAGKDNWTKWPRQMLTARVISEGVRAVFPGATGGFYDPSEVGDMVDVTPPKPTKGKTTETGIPPAMKPAWDEALAKDRTPPHDAETGEIFPPSDNVGGDVQTSMRTTPAPEQTDESEKAEAWCNEAIRRLDAATSVEAIDNWLTKNKQMLARMRAANDEAAMAVVSAADYRRRQLEPVG